MDLSQKDSEQVMCQIYVLDINEVKESARQDEFLAGYKNEPFSVCRKGFAFVNDW